MRRVRWLAAKEWRELAAARPTLLFALALGPLVGHTFVTAVQSYAEVSGAGGGPAALSQGLSPLDGIVVPTFGAYAIAATLLFPFVAIRLVSSEKETGALSLLLQARPKLATMVLVKFLVLVGAWIVAWIPGLVALIMWRAYGGHLHAPEVATVLVGYLLRGVLVIALAMAAAAATEGAASAAVVTLAITLGTWALDFIAQVRGGRALAIARFTPDAVIRVFERGELRLDIVAVTVIVAATALALAIAWLRPARTRPWIASRTLAVLGVAAVGIVAAARLRASWDLSEDRRNSFASIDERALRRIHSPLDVQVHLAPEDPRLADLEREVLHKLRRTLPDVRVTYSARSSTGLFEGPGEHYGEVWYALDGRQVMTRSTTEPIVLETIYQLARIPPVERPTESAYPGYPLVANPGMAAPILYGLWPLAVALFWWSHRRPRALAITS
jgi:ABC-type transport system involved in multi-copper enzyme maturation permease subunit